MKKLKNDHKYGLDMETCLKKFHELPEITWGRNDVNRGCVDGNKKVCRLLHSFMTTKIDIHCLNVSFEAEEENNGKYK